MSHDGAVIRKKGFENEPIVRLGIASKVKERSVQTVHQVHATVEVLECVTQDAAEEVVEEYRGQNATLPHSIGDVERCRSFAR